MMAIEREQRLGVFLQALARSGNVSLASEIAGISRRTLYDRRRDDPEFAREWEDALQVSYDAVEHVVRQRAVEGWLEPVYYQGEKVGELRKWSDSNAQFYLKAKRPQEFRERMEISGQVDVAAVILERRRRAGIASDEPS